MYSLLSAGELYGGVITGEVLDRSCGESLMGATISLVSDSLSSDQHVTSTDVRGRYTIPNVPVGRYTLTISHVGFSTKHFNDVTISDSDTIAVSVSLMPVAIDLEATTVTASRRQEKVLEAPASVSAVESEEIETRPALTVTEHVKALPAVDAAATGLSQSSLVIRGFNNVFSSASLILTDHRIARVPSLRFNAYNFIPTVDQDIERIEVVSGPGSALYGPNAASGVVHVVTKSPFTSRGTTVSIGGGERDVFIGSLRHAGNAGTWLGYKISGQYYEGNDWPSSDPAEPDSIQLFRPGPAGPIPEGDSLRNKRDFRIEKIAGEARVDVHLHRGATLILNGGLNSSSNLELTPLGAGQAVDWIYSFVQARLKYGNLFVQGFVNASDAGDTYLLRTGQRIVDKSRLWAGQLQHQWRYREWLRLVYGLDALFTRPNTEGTISGRNEATDGSDEVGVYCQSDIGFSDAWRIVGAVRLDQHSQMDDLQFSPRTAVVYQFSEDNSMRLTYNRAFSTPDNTNLHLDILESYDPFGVGIDIRAQGVPQTGFHWPTNEHGPQFRSPFASYDPRELSTTDPIDFNDPTFTNTMWTIGRTETVSGYAAALRERGIGQDTIDALTESMFAVTPSLVIDVQNALRRLNPSTQSFDPMATDGIADIGCLRPTITQTFEMGYKGLIGDRLRVSIDLYRTQKHDFIGPLTVETPNVFLDSASLSLYLDHQLDSSLSDPTNADYTATLALLDDPAFGGDGDGSPADELRDLYSYGAGRIPFGTVSPQESLDPEDVLLTFRNYADIALYGADLAFVYHLSQDWTLGANYSYISKNIFERSRAQVHDVFVNAPKHKLALSAGYTSAKDRLNVHVRLRFVDAFEMYSPFDDTRVPSYVVSDMNASWRSPMGPRLDLSVQNILNKKHIEFAGAPRIGRLAILRVSQSF